jgi:hypothetical protein
LNDIILDVYRLGCGGFLTEFGAASGSDITVDTVNFLLNLADVFRQSWTWWYDYFFLLSLSLSLSLSLFLSFFLSFSFLMYFFLYSGNSNFSKISPLPDRTNRSMTETVR